MAVLVPEIVEIMKLKLFMVVFAGSYDHTVRLFDARTKSSVMTIEHGHPVESVLLFPSGGLLVSAGNSIKSNKSNFFSVVLILGNTSATYFLCGVFV